jgi:hypothetical protein
MLCAVATGCGIAAERAAKKEAAEKRAAKKEAARKEADEAEAARKKAADEKEAAEKKADDEKVAADKKADEEKKEAAKKAAVAAANSYVKVKVEVELRGVLTCTDEAVTITIVREIISLLDIRNADEVFGADRFEKVKWVLDFGQDKEMRAKAKALDGKTALVEGTATLRGIRKSFLDLEPKVAVKSLVAATKE